jgi:uncharacterized membrane protein YsdA (DUF1294 family)
VVQQWIENVLRMPVSRNLPNVRPTRRGALSGSVFVILAALLLLPGLALIRSSGHVDRGLLVGAMIVVSVFAFLAYGSDKRRAESGRWRVPESTLQLIALFGGWPGAYLGQRYFRHKISKLSFQCAFWFVVLIHQLAALDSLFEWRCTKQFFGSLFDQSRS